MSNDHEARIAALEREVALLKGSRKGCSIETRSQLAKLWNAGPGSKGRPNVDETLPKYLHTSADKRWREHGDDLIEIMKGQLRRLMGSRWHMSKTCDGWGKATLRWLLKEGWEKCLALDEPNAKPSTAAIPAMPEEEYKRMVALHEREERRARAEARP